MNDVDIQIGGTRASLIAGGARLDVDLGRGTFTLSACADLILPEAFVAAALGEGSLLRSDERCEHRASCPGESTLEVEHVWDNGCVLTQRFRAAPIEGGVLLEVELRPGGEPLAVETLRPLVIETTKGIPSAVEPGAGLWMWRFGTVSPGDPVLFLPIDSADIPRTSDAYRWLIEEDDRTGFAAEMLAVFRSQGSGRTCLLGYATVCDQAAGFIVSRPKDAFDRVRLESRCDLEGLRVEPGATVRSETLLILPTNDPWQAVERYAELLRERYVPRLPARSLTGWSDWQYYRRDVRESDVVENLETLAAERYPIEYVLVDDGYQKNMSDWLRPNEKFPHGMRWLAGRIRDKGFTPGIWIAPLTAHASSDFAREHPDWLLRDARGDVLAHETHMGTIHAVDYTAEGAAEWLRILIRTLVRDYGFGWIKLDGPIRRYYEGGLFRRPMTSVQHIRYALGIIREEVGEAIVEGEGYYGPSLGLVDTQRITQDIQPDWQRLKHTAQVNLLSTFMHRRWWINNPDAFILRDHPSDRFEFEGRPEPVMTLDELQTEITALALSGGVVMLTDEMKRLPDERKRLVDAFLPVYERPARPVDLFNGKTCPEIFHQKIETEWENYDVVAVFNWQDSPRTMSVPLEDIELEPAQRRVAFEYWTQEFLGAVGGKLDVGEIGPHGVRVVALRPVRERPFVMGTDLHLTQGGVELQGLAWDEALRKLSFTLSSWMRRTARVHIYVPDGLEMKNIGLSGALGRSSLSGPQHLVVEYDAGGEVGFDLFFRRRSDIPV